MIRLLRWRAAYWLLPPKQKRLEAIEQAYEMQHCISPRPRPALHSWHRKALRGAWVVERRNEYGCIEPARD